MRRIDLDSSIVRQMFVDRNMTIREICVELRCSEPPVFRALVGVPRRRRGARPRPPCRSVAIDKAGYSMIFVPEHPHANAKGYVREHRLVMEKKLGRYLNPSETVHHIDENKANNDPNNLELMGTRGDHIRHHNLMRSTATALRAMSTGELAEMFLRDSSLSIAAKFDTSPATVQRIMIERGIPVPHGRQGRRAVRKHLQPESTLHHSSERDDA